MPIIAKAGESRSFVPCPPGLHQGVCCDVVDLGMVKTQFGDGEAKLKHMVRIVWQVDHAMEDGKRFTVQRRYTLSLHEKAALRHDLESWRGKPFTFDELAGFDLERLIGVNGQLNVMHQTRDGETYANVQGIVPLGRGMTKMTVENYIRVKDRTEQEQEPPPPDESDYPF